MNNKFEDSYQLGLRMMNLEVESPQDALVRLGLVVLDKVIDQAGLIEVGLVVGLHEIAPAVAEDFRLDNHDTVNRRLCECEHVCSSF